MAHLNAGVLATVQQGGARFLTAQQRSLAAAHRLAAKHPPTELVLRPEDNPTDLIKRGVPDLPTDARFCYKGRTLWTRSRMAQTEEACKETLFRSLFAAFKDVYFSRLTCYRDGYSPRRSFSCRTCCRSCVESRCAATQGSSLYLQSKESSDDGEFHFNRIPHCHVSQGWGGSPLTAEAGVGGRVFQGDVLAGGTTPAFSRV